LAQGVENRVDGIRIQKHITLKLGGAREQSKIFAATGEQAVKIDRVESICLSNSIRKARSDILIEIQARSSKGQIKVSDNGIYLGLVANSQERLCAIVLDPTPPLAPMKAMIRPAG